MATNEALNKANSITMAAPLAANSGVGPISGDPLVFGRGTSPSFGLAGVAETSYTPPTGTPTGNISVKFDGAWFLSVLAKDDIGGSSVAIGVGDPLYATGGTYDSVTNCLYGFTLTANATAGVYFGNALDAITAGQTATIRVRLKGSGRA
jgi:hypothetical protein